MAGAEPSAEPLAPAPLPSAAVLTIDLAAVVANHRLLARLAAPAAVAGVVKADAYGLGAAQVAPALARAGCRDFFVAQLGEALALRPLLPPDATLTVLNGVLAGEEAAFAANALRPALNDLGQVARWAAAARRRGHALEAAIQFDTGMSRLGLSPAEADRLAADPGLASGIDVALVMSHLVVSEELDHPLNRVQLERFAALRRHWPLVRASLANSSGVFLGPEWRFDLVRPGAATYGINPLPGPSSNGANPMQPVATLTAPVLQVRAIDHPESVGYGATHRVGGPTRIATIGCGYADGWLRSLSNRGSAFVGASRVPVVGRVSMDLITLDVTSVPDLAVGDRVELMGPHLPVDDVAEAAGTNGYEVLTRLGTRFHRVYIGDR
jgi:alanine racemase